MFGDREFEKVQFDQFRQINKLLLAGNQHTSWIYHCTDLLRLPRTICYGENLLDLRKNAY